MTVDESPRGDASQGEHVSGSREGFERVRVGVAEFDVATGDAVLTTSGLGSCLGVALGDSQAGVAGLAHVMVPTETDDAKPAKSVGEGVDRLLAAVLETGASRARLEAKLAGGSTMLDFSGVGEAVGDRNVERAREVLAARDVPVVAADVGGDHGRSLRLHPSRWTLVVESQTAGRTEL